MVFEDKEDMSIEDILASIRKYVADDDAKKSQNTEEPPVIHLTRDQITETTLHNEDENFYNAEAPQHKEQEPEEQVSHPQYQQEEPVQKKSLNPFSKLAHVVEKRTTSKTSNINEWLENIVRDEIRAWIDTHVSSIVERKVEEMVTLEIARIKNSN